MLLALNSCHAEVYDTASDLNKYYVGGCYIDYCYVNDTELVYTITNPYDYIISLHIRERGFSPTPIYNEYHSKKHAFRVFPGTHTYIVHDLVDPITGRYDFYIYGSQTGSTVDSVWVSYYSN